MKMRSVSVASGKWMMSTVPQISTMRPPRATSWPQPPRGRAFCSGETAAGGPPPESSLIVRRVATWRHVLCCSPAYLQAHGPIRELAELAQHNCLRYALYPFEEWRFV